MSIQLIKINPLQCHGVEPVIAPVGDIWICGGAIRQWFIGSEKPSDIDVFGKSDVALSQFAKTVLKDCPIISQNPNTDTYDYKGQWVQLIKFYHPTIESVLDSFDFTVCQFGWDGKDIYSTPSAVISVLRGHLGVHQIKGEFAADSLRRAFKYQKKGYQPCAGTIRQLGLSFVSLTPEQINNQVEISPNGGRRIVGID